MKGYDSPKDYYDNYLFGRSPEDVARKEVQQYRLRVKEREEVSRQMKEYRELYGD
jgi:hypothetical protein